MSDERQIYALHDSVIAEIARILTQAILFKTDVTDHMRMLRFEPMRDNPELLMLTQEYVDYGEETIQRLLDVAEELQKDAKE